MRYALSKVLDDIFLLFGTFLASFFWVLASLGSLGWALAVSVLMTIAFCGCFWFGKRAFGEEKRKRTAEKARCKAIARQLATMPKKLALQAICQAYAETHKIQSEQCEVEGYRVLGEIAITVHQAVEKPLSEDELLSLWREQPAGELLVYSTLPISAALQPPTGCKVRAIEEESVLCANMAEPPVEAKREKRSYQAILERVNAASCFRTAALLCALSIVLGNLAAAICGITLALFAGASRLFSRHQAQ